MIYYIYALHVSQHMKLTSPDVSINSGSLFNIMFKVECFTFPCHLHASVLP
jgi:hypothetical protein